MPRNAPDSRFRTAALLVIAAVGWCGLRPALLRAAAPKRAEEVTAFSLSDDFSYADNRAESTWSYRLDDSARGGAAVFPLLPSAARNANQLWGSNFHSPPKMLSDAAGYWGIGKNLSGQPQYSPRNGTQWAPGEVLLHPKGGGSPSGLVIAWTAPRPMRVDVRYTFGLAARPTGGVGLRLTQRIGRVDTEVVAMDNIGDSLANSLTGIAVGRGDQLFFRIDTCGEPEGDIVRADIRIMAAASLATDAGVARPVGGTVVAGCDFTFTVPAAGARTFQWRKNGRPIAGATSAAYRLRDVKAGDAGTYSVLLDGVPSGDAAFVVTPARPMREQFSSPTPRQVYSRTLAEQEKELKTSPLMLRFAESRKRLAADPYRPAYHFVSPEGQMNDPNGLCFWQGRGHLFYQAFPPDKFPDPKNLRERLLQAHWGHAVTDDWVHWRDLPYAIYPGVEHMCASGGTLVEPHRVVAFYPGWAAGQMAAVSSDPLLLNWEKLRGKPVNSPASGDSCIWKEGDAYLGLIGCRTLLSSPNLIDWKLQNADFLAGSPLPIDDGSCPTFLRLGEKHILLLFSHGRGGQYLVGDYDRGKARFVPYEHGRFNHGVVAPGGVHAPSAVADGHRGAINILNLNDGKHSDDWDQLLSLSQRLTLGPDKRLRIEPVEAVATLRAGHQRVGRTPLPANRDVFFPSIRGSAMELDLQIDPVQSRWVQLDVLRSPGGEERTSITFYNYDRKLAFWYPTQGVLCLDGSRSSTRPDVWPRPPERAVFERGAEPLRLRVFVDRSVVEVFANGKLFMAMRVYPGRADSTGVALRAQGQDAMLECLDAWTMRPIF